MGVPRFADGCEGKRSACVTCQQAVTAPVSLHSPAVAVTHIGTSADLNVISEKWPKSGEKDERPTVCPRLRRR